LPNQYYLDLIYKYAPPGANVTIYTERQSYEPLDDFGFYNLYLDGSIQDVWRRFLTSDVLILSKSTFSLVPAILSRRDKTKVIYTPFWHRPLPGWEVVDPIQMDRTSQITTNLAAKCQR
jgi:hypothetical protein